MHTVLWADNQRESLDLRGILSAINHNPKAQFIPMFLCFFDIPITFIAKLFMYLFLNRILFWNFGNNFRATEKLPIVQRVPICLYPVSPTVSISHNHGTFVKTKKPTFKP